MRFFLLLELFLELRVGLLKIMDVVLEQPCFSCTLLVQLVKLFAKIDVVTPGLQGHKPSNHICASIKSRIYTTELARYHNTYHEIKRINCK
jgi:hypothetical protein